MIDREQDRRFKNHINKIHGPVDADLFSDLGTIPVAFLFVTVKPEPLIPRAENGSEGGT